MAHVHGSSAGAAQAGKHAAHAAHDAHSAHAAHHAAHASQHAAHAAHAAHGSHAAHASHAAHHAAHAAQHASHATHVAHAAGAMVVAKGVAVSGVRKKAGKSFLGKVFSHPLVLFGLGVAVGYTIHKYRKEIIHSANRAAEQGKDFVLQQRENLEDLLGESPAGEN